jgi:putative membrane protein insertion efficiency factor
MPGHLGAGDAPAAPRARLTPGGVAVAALRAYKALISPILPRSCRFVPTCSEYAAQAIADRGLARGAALAVMRLLRCHPFHPGGYDPPPRRREHT